MAERTRRELAEVAARMILERDPPRDVEISRAEIDMFVAAMAREYPEALLKVYAEAEEEVRRLRAELRAYRNLPTTEAGFDRSRDDWGRRAREVWVASAKWLFAVAPEWLVPYEKLDDCEKEAWCRIGETIAAEANAAGHVACNRITLVREILGAQDNPHQTVISAAHGAMHRIEELMAEVERLKACVRHHHDQRGDDRCHLDDLKLYHDALGIVPDPYVTALPPDEDMLESCRRYIRQRQHPDVHGKYLMPGCMTIRQLTDEVDRLLARPAVFVSILVEDEAFRILFLRRAPGASYAGHWCLPGGKVESGESLEHCCHRELGEETGLVADGFRLEGVIEVPGPPHWIGLVYRAQGVAGSPGVMEPSKHCELGWFGRDALPAPLTPGDERFYRGSGPPKVGDPGGPGLVDAMRELRDAGGSAWDDVDDVGEILGRDEAEAPGFEIDARFQDRLVFDPNVSEDSPVIRGTWCTVKNVVSLIVDGWTWSDLMRTYPEITADDIRACLAYTVADGDEGKS